MLLCAGDLLQYTTVDKQLGFAKILGFAMTNSADVLHVIFAAAYSRLDAGSWRLDRRKIVVLEPDAIEGAVAFIEVGEDVVLPAVLAAS